MNARDAAAATALANDLIDHGYMLPGEDFLRTEHIVIEPGWRPSETTPCADRRCRCLHGVGLTTCAVCGCATSPKPRGT